MLLCASSLSKFLLLLSSKVRCTLAALCLVAALGSGSLRAATVIACAGDSITYGYETNNPSPVTPPPRSYPAQLQNLLGSGYTVLNFGKSGAALIDGGASHPAYNSTTEYQSSLSSNPNIVIIQLGTNDSEDGNWQQQNSSNFVSHYVSLINSYKNLPTHPKVILALCVWTPIDGWENVLYYELEPLTRLVANLTGCDFIDNHYPLYYRPYDFSDYLHPNDAGYAVLARSVYDFLIFRSTSANFGTTTKADNTTSPPPENLDDKYTVNAIYGNTTKFSNSGGVDRFGHAYSADLLPALVGPSTISSLDWRDSFSAPVCSFFMGHPDYKNAVSNGYTVALPNNRYSAIRLLGAAVLGAQTNQTFTIAYEDGSTATQSLNLSDWTSTGAVQSGEIVVANCPYRTTYAGVAENKPTRLYGYTLNVDSNRVLKSVTLPSNPNVVILGVALTGQTNAILGTLSKTTTGSILAKDSNQYVGAAYAAGAPLQANRTSVGTWETFDVTPVSASASAPNRFAGIFSVNARFNNSLVQTTLESSDATAPLGANGPGNGSTPAVANEFAWISNSDGTFSLQSLVNGRYASLGNGSGTPTNLWAGDGNKTVKASASTLTNTEKFTFK